LGRKKTEPQSIKQVSPNQSTHIELGGGCRDTCTKKGMIHDPVGKAKSVVLTEEGLAKCRELFAKHFGTT